MKCSKCGREIDDNIEYCPYCGNKLKKNENNLIGKLKYLFLSLSTCAKVGAIIIAIQIVVSLLSIFSFDADEILIKISILLEVLLFAVPALYIDHRNQVGYKRLKWLKWVLLFLAAFSLSMNATFEYSPTSSNKTNTTKSSQTTTKTDTNNDSLYYTTNDATTVKKGTVGMYAYVLNKDDEENRVFFLIDLDDGYVYLLTEQSDDVLRMDIVSGNLKDSLKVITLDGESYIIKFKNSDSAKNAVLTVDSTGNSRYMDAAYIDSVIKMINKKTIYDYSADAEETVETKESLYYTTNDEDSVKNGDSGVFAYVKKGSNYDIYIIIDFDEGYYYYFKHGDGSMNGDKVKITSGTLKEKVVITYDDGGGSQWCEGISFKDSSITDKAYWYDADNFEYEFTATDLQSALTIRDSKTLTDYSPK